MLNVKVSEPWGKGSSNVHRMCMYILHVTLQSCMLDMLKQSRNSRGKRNKHSVFCQSVYDFHKGEPLLSRTC